MRRAGIPSEAEAAGAILLLCYCTGQGRPFSGHGDLNFTLRKILKEIPG
jgi:hypothetical protein